jgi:ribonuclease PH
LIGRSLRAAVRLESLPEITCIVDCDVLQADGGTRTASISGGYIALALALKRFCSEQKIDPDVFLPAVAAVSAGVIEGETFVDLNFGEDSSAEFDLNVVMNAERSLIEVQGTAEAGAIDRQEFLDLLSVCEMSIGRILDFQRENLRAAGVALGDGVWGL